jgi:polar amino acid transport system substrate-binding protein
MNRKMIAAMMAAAMVVSMGSATVCMAEEERTTFVVGFDAEYPPYGYMDDDGEYTGFDLELAEAVCEMEGWELEKKTDQLGFQGYGTELRIHRLYLEWIYHEWP